MTWIVTDAAGELHEILEDERVLVVGFNQTCVRDWLKGQGLPPYGKPFVVNPSPLALQGARWTAVVELDCLRHAHAHHGYAAAIDHHLSLLEKKLPTPPRKIRATCE